MGVAHNRDPYSAPFYVDLSCVQIGIFTPVMVCHKNIQITYLGMGVKVNIYGKNGYTISRVPTTVKLLS